MAMACWLPLAVERPLPFAVEASLGYRKLPVWKPAINSSMRLQRVVRHWAQKHLGREERSLPTGVRCVDDQGADLDLGAKLSELLPRLPLREGRFAILLFWPAAVPPEPSGRAEGGGSKLSTLGISTRYANVDGNVVGFHRSTTRIEKHLAGAYLHTTGLYNQDMYASAMQIPPPCRGTAEFRSFDLMVKASDRLAQSEELFRVQLQGPVDVVANWRATCARFEALCKKGRKAEDTSTPLPVFIPSRGRPQRAHLNWEAPHVFGRRQAAASPGSEPVVCVVVEPGEAAAYRAAWPSSLLLVLPKDGGGPGFARWVVQRVCTLAYDARGNVCRLPFCWICDDNLTMFYRLVGLRELAASGFLRPRGAHRQKKREAAEGEPMFRKSMLAVQRHKLMPGVAVSGFLRDDGTAVCKRLDWKMDELSMYKIVLLNLGKLQRLEVECLPVLRLWEDIHLLHQVLRKPDHQGRTLKCQCFCFRASHSTSGGCVEQRHGKRSGSESTQLENLLPRDEFERLDNAKQEVVLEIVDWAQSKERQSQELPRSESQEIVQSLGHAQCKELLQTLDRRSCKASTTPSTRSFCLHTQASPDKKRKRAAPIPFDANKNRDAIGRFLGKTDPKAMAKKATKADPKAAAKKGRKS